MRVLCFILALFSGVQTMSASAQAQDRLMPLSQQEFDRAVESINNNINWDERYLPNNPRAVPRYDELFARGDEIVPLALDYLRRTAEERGTKKIDNRRLFAIFVAHNTTIEAWVLFMKNAIEWRKSQFITEDELIDIMAPYKSVTYRLYADYKDPRVIDVWKKAKDIINEDLRRKEAFDYLISGGHAREVPPT